MPLMRYFLFVGTALLALLFIVDACLPKLPVVESANTPVNIATDLSVIRIHSDRKWPARVEFDTSIPTITPAPVRTADASVPATSVPAIGAPATVADVVAPAHMRDAFAQLQTAGPKKTVPKKRRAVAKSRQGPPVILVAQQPRLGFFGNTMW